MADFPGMLEKLRELLRGVSTTFEASEGEGARSAPGDDSEYESVLDLERDKIEFHSKELGELATTFGHPDRARIVSIVKRAIEESTWIARTGCKIHTDHFDPKAAQQIRRRIDSSILPLADECQKLAEELRHHLATIAAKPPRVVNLSDVLPFVKQLLPRLDLIIESAQHLTQQERDGSERVSRRAEFCRLLRRVEDTRGPLFKIFQNAMRPADTGDPIVIDLVHTVRRCSSAICGMVSRSFGIRFFPMAHDAGTGESSVEYWENRDSDSHRSRFCGMSPVPAINATSLNDLHSAIDALRRVYAETQILTESDFHLAWETANKCSVKANQLIRSAGLHGSMYFVAHFAELCCALEEGFGRIPKVGFWLRTVSIGPHGIPPETEATAHELAWRFSHRLWLGINNYLDWQHLPGNFDDPSSRPSFAIPQELLLRYSDQLVRKVAMEPQFDESAFRPHLQLERDKGLAEFRKSSRTTITEWQQNSPQTGEPTYPNAAVVRESYGDVARLSTRHDGLPAMSDRSDRQAETIDKNLHSRSTGVSKLDSKQFEALHKVVTGAFTVPDLRQLVKFYLDEDLDNILNPNASASNVVFELIHWTERTGRTRKFVDAICEKNPGNPDVAALRTSLFTSDADVKPGDDASRPIASEPTNRSLRVFISYSIRDAAIADEVVAALQRAGVDLWIDRTEIKPGDSFVERMNSGLAEAGYVVLLWSKSAQESHWVQQEYQSALALKRVVLCPLIIEPVPLPPMLAHLHAIDLTRDRPAGLKKLSEFLKAETQSPVATRSVTAPPPKFGDPAPTLRGLSRRDIRMVVAECLSDADLQKYLWDLNLKKNDMQGETVNDRLVWLLHSVEKIGELELFLDYVAHDHARCVANQVQKITAN